MPWSCHDWDDPPNVVQNIRERLTLPAISLKKPQQKKIFFLTCAAIIIEKVLAFFEVHVTKSVITQAFNT